MIRLTTLVLLVASFTVTLAPASAQDMVEGDAASRTAIVAVIESQIAAFRRDDGDAAFAHAAPGIRAQFGSPDRFMQMVRSSYTSVYRPRSVEFRRLLVVRGEPVQEVFFVGLDLSTMLALYRMEQQPDGSWLINGVLVADTKEQAT
ncbi:MAG: DUF4864 domain-containing protein [Alphaproteobacteria bacterium]